MPDPSTGRHLLLVVRHFGPAGHTGGFRWWRLVASLVADHGWTVDVVTTDEVVVGEPPPGVRVVRVSDDWVGSRLRRAVGGAMARLRPGGGPADASGAATVPSSDAPWPGRQDRVGRVGRVVRDVLRATKLTTELVWGRRAARAACASPRRPDVVVGSQPSEAAPLAAMRAAEHHGVPLVVDHRHVWGLGQPATSVRSRTDGLFARVAAPPIDRRSALAVDIAATATAHVGRLPASPPRAFVPSGWDPLDAPGTSVDATLFRIVHTGWLYPFHDPRPLTEGLGRLLDAHPGLDERLRLEMVGTPRVLAGVDLVDLGAAAGIPRSAWSFVDRVPKPVAMDRAGRAAALVAWSFPDGLQAPSKLYDYALCAGELVLIGAPDDALARDAAQLGVATVQDAAGVARVLTRAHDRWLAGGPWPVNDPDGLLAAATAAARLHPLLVAVADQRDVAATAQQVAPPWPPAPDVLCDVTT